jgi:hypothetical protein
VGDLHSPQSTFEEVLVFEHPLRKLYQDSSCRSCAGASHACIALIMQAVLERAAEEQEDRSPAFVYIDEAAEYFDQNIDTLLIQARKYKVGITFAHLHLHQLKAEFRASVMTTAAVRFARGVSGEDARALKSDMRTSAEFLLAMKMRNRIDTQFACYVQQNL